MNSGAERQIYVVRHGETAWTISGQHTGRTDLPLTAGGEAQARGLAASLSALPFDHVLCSPLKRARRTCELAGFGAVATLDPDLVEWDYGLYEGRTLADIHQERPEWELFRDGCPGGESVQQISARADRVVARLASLAGNVLVFSSGHLLRVLAARWIVTDAALGRHLLLDPAAVSVLNYDHGGADRALTDILSMSDRAPISPTVDMALMRSGFRPLRMRAWCQCTWSPA